MFSGKKRKWTNQTHANQTTWNQTLQCPHFCQGPVFDAASLLGLLHSVGELCSRLTERRTTAGQGEVDSACITLMLNAYTQMYVAWRSLYKSIPSSLWCIVIGFAKNENFLGYLFIQFVILIYNCWQSYFCNFVKVKYLGSHCIACQCVFFIQFMILFSIVVARAVSIIVGPETCTLIIKFHI